MPVETNVAEIADGIYRISTYLDQAGPHGFTFNQFLVDAEEPLLFHTGLLATFPATADAIRSVMPLDRLRWITFGHFEADECGAMNEFLAAAPQSQVAHGALGVMVTVADQTVRPPRPLADGEVLDLGGKRMRRLETPHVPHAWDSGLFFEETTGTLFAGDLFSIGGRYPATSSDDMLAGAIEMELALHATALTPQLVPTIERLADLEPTALATMHNVTYVGNGAAALRDLARWYRGQLAGAT